MNGIIEIDLVVYPFSIIVFFKQDYSVIKDTLLDRISQDHCDDIELLNEDYEAKTVSFHSGHTVIVFNVINQGLIVHEVFHAISFVMQRIGIPFSDDTKEAYAYLIQYLFQEINNNLQTHEDNKE